MAAMEAEKEQKLRELQDRQERMFNWEDQVKASEDALMEGFRKQKEEMMAKKLADQQKEILKDMNKADVDALLDKHKRQLMQMDSTLKQEQERQLKMMREKMLGKGRKAAQDKIMRQIKMAEIQKKKTEEMQKAQALMSQQQLSAAQVVPLQPTGCKRRGSRGQWPIKPQVAPNQAAPVEEMRWLLLSMVSNNRPLAAPAVP